MDQLPKKAKLIRKLCLVSTTDAGSGHPTSCLSAADLMTVLFDDYFVYDINNIQNPNNDRIIFSKGHAAPLLYSLFAISGAIPIEELKTLRKINSPLEGHPTPNFPFAEVATGSLGQGLSVGAGMAIAIQKSKFNENLPKVYVLLGDGEMAEGSNWEAANFASFYKLNNLIVILDVNKLGQNGETMFGHNVEEYADRFRAFGWEIVIIDGHDFEEIKTAFNIAVRNQTDRPLVIIAKTIKGKGISFLEDKKAWHGKALDKEQLKKALEELGDIDEGLRFNLKFKGSDEGRLSQIAEDAHQSLLQKQGEIHSLNENRQPKILNSDVLTKSVFSSSASGHPIPKDEIENFASSSLDTLIATREAYGKALVEIGKKSEFVFALDAEVENSTYSEEFKKVFPQRFIECFIAEQNMVGVALGLSSRGKIPFVSTFAAFLTRAFDQIRMAAISKANIKFVGSHAGVSIGEDGPSQMGLEDISMFGSIPNSVILHPCDAVSCFKLVNQMFCFDGIFYLRTIRPKTPVIYAQNKDFKIGGSNVLKESEEDLLTIVACGITVHEALEAWEILRKEGINIRVIDCYCLKPLDTKTIIDSVNKTKKKTIITVEDHYEHGGLGDMVLSSVAKEGVKVVKMAVTRIPRSGSKEDLLEYCGINAKHIIEKVKSLI